jgi:hypothetical protein
LSIYKVQPELNPGEKGIACSPEGRFWAIEVKKPGGKPSSDQISFLNLVRANNGIGIVAHSIDDVWKGPINLIPPRFCF